jgi:hypothetical protein
VRHRLRGGPVDVAVRGVGDRFLVLHADHCPIEASATLACASL